MQAEVERLRACVNEQQATIDGLKKQIIQMQVSAIRVEGATSPFAASVVAQLDRIQGEKE
jgi:hypothetical protein